MVELKLLKEVLDFSHEKITTIDFVTKEKSNSYSISIYCSLIELAKSFHTLIGCKEYTGSLSIYRTFLENYVELINLINDNKYLKHIELEFYEHKLRTLNSAEKGNVYLVSLLEFTGIEIPKNKLRINEIKQELGIKNKYRIKEKFSMANMLGEYEAVYTELCSESHCNLGALFSRHFEYDEENKQIGISIYNSDVADRYSYYICALAMQLIDAGIRVVSSLDPKLKPEFEAFKRSFDEQFMVINT
ncbi:TPA: hypothetical protein NJ487_004488 [Vibrio parahaemolyticus]|uniref:DUF5677 domain-containing protein n=1 Tax=Vibrio parahaemolyticus TaxID=670 RepID=UPI00111F2AB5|nr:DUF5677 domain-containing protein [Vibrio parahaemolyticus]HDU8579752.1 hypothetical protein [Vibrio diabolicus]EGR1559829.1 hypothetical protein [Vibrio parahaemolyticus]EGR3003472.1 hypothetical protein [Vibrio parahaemolyticus]MBE4404164.1 hypothetical protein [Vibrio parahaemolyticus]MCC3822265.1 hypothetical protein [Vibrio parahaemolyticus]